MSGPLQPAAWDHGRLDGSLTAAVQRLQHRPDGGGKKRDVRDEIRMGGALGFETKIQDSAHHMVCIDTGLNVLISSVEVMLKPL